LLGICLVMQILLEKIDKKESQLAG